MADDDQTDNAEKFRDERDKYAKSQDPPVEVRRAELVQPAEKPAEQKPQESTAETEEKGYVEMLTKIQQESATRTKEMQDRLMPALNEFAKLASQPAPASPVPTALPAPPNEQQKGGLSEFVFNLLKFGALAAVAYGASGRGRGHNAIYKSAIGAALKGYATGRKDVADHAMTVWEKNREIINDANREQDKRYQTILDNKQTNLKQKMDLLNEISKIYGDYRTWDDSRRQDLTAARDHLDKRTKLQRDKEQWEIEHREELYSLLGKSEINNKYLAWLHEKARGKVDLSKIHAADDWYKVEKEHPEWSFSEFLRFNTEEENKAAIEKAGAEEGAKETARLKAKKGAEEDATKVPNASENAEKAAKLLESLVQ